MSVLDIVLIIIGFILVGISYYITEKVSVDNKTEDSSVTEVWGQKEEVTIKERVKTIVSDKSEEMIETVEDRLCHLSNDKIIEFKEYSDQVMESIKYEHKQAVFLYNMLTEKEESIKKLLNTLDVKYASVSDKLNKLDQKSKIDNYAKDTVAEGTENVAKIKPSISAASDPTGIQKTDVKNHNTVDDNKNVKKVQKINKNPNIGEKAGPDRNDRILNLWKQGKTVLEISRQLGIGQGEVKLVIDLFKGD